MYENYFGFKEKPFNITPDPRFIYFSEQHVEALDHVLYGIRERKGFIAVTGEVGSGKTTLCRALLDKLDQTIQTAYIFNPCLSGGELLRTIADDLEVKVKGRTKKHIIDALNLFFLDQLNRGNNVVFILDEAQGLGKQQLEQVRLLSNLETDTEKLIQIVLVGQPELREKLDDPSMRQLKQRITVQYHIDPLPKSEIPKYIDHRMRVAGAEKRFPYFTEGALEVIYDFSGGVPRLINVVCDRALLSAFVWETWTVSEDIACRAVSEVRGERIVEQPIKEVMT